MALDELEKMENKLLSIEEKAQKEDDSDKLELCSYIRFHLDRIGELPTSVPDHISSVNVEDVYIELTGKKPKVTDPILHQKIVIQ